MTAKTMALSQEAYDALVALKADGESFSEVVLRLTGAHVRLSAYAGAWKGADPRKIARFRKFLADSDRLSSQKLQRIVRIAQSCRTT